MNKLRLSLILLLGLGLCGCAACKTRGATSKSSAGKIAVRLNDAPGVVKQLRISASVDGSGRIVFSRQEVRYEHKHWSPPWNVTLNGEPWNSLEQTPAGWRELSARLDLTKAWIISRNGRDVVALEQTPEGFDLYLDDSPNGAADYEITIAIPQRD